MKEEIKEILGDLDNKECYINNETILTFDEAKQLLDYITNLQEENVRFREIICFNEYYKSRIDKAIEYINHAQNYGTMAQVMPHLKSYVNGADLLNILQGEEK